MSRPRPIVQAAICMLAVCTLLLIGCSRHITRTDVPSRDGRLVLRIEVNESGGAAVPDVTSAFILSAQSSTAHEELVFRGSAMSHFNGSWSNSGEVRLSFRGGYVTTCKTSVILPSNLKITVMGCKP